jgi:ATP-dependent Clp protease adapter protein ClpS
MIVGVEPMESAALPVSLRMPRRADHETFDIQCYTSRVFPAVRLAGHESDDGDPCVETLYEVRIIDNNFNTYQEVMGVCMAALGVTPEQAYRIAWEVDHDGCCVVAVGPLDQAEKVAAIIRTIGIDVQVNPVNLRWRT